MAHSLWEHALNHYKTNKGPNFQYAKFPVIDLLLTDRRNLSVTRPKSAHGKSSSCRFSFSATRNASTEATKYVTFGFPFHILVFFLFEESLNVSVRKRYIFFSVLAAIIRKNFDKQTWIENGEGFTVHSSTWPSGAKGEWRISSWLAISNTCYYGISQGWKSLNNTVGYTIKEFIVLSDIHIRWKKKSWLVLEGVKPRTFP